MLRTGYSKRAVTALQSFSDSSATGIIFVDMSEHADCGVERRHFSLKTETVLQCVSELVLVSYLDA